MDKKFMDFEVKASVEEGGIFTGYASTFGGKPDSKGDVVLPGAFKESIAKGGRNRSGIVLLWQHRADEPIGTFTELIEDKRGLKVTGKLILTTPTGRKAFELLRAGAVRHMSIGFDVLDYEMDRKKKVRYLKEVDLWEISLVSFPALLSAKVTSVKSESDLQSELVRLGLSETDARRVPDFCTVCLKVGGLCSEDITAISEYLGEYPKDVIAEVIMVAEQYTCGKTKACATDWSGVAQSVKALGEEIDSLECEAKGNLKVLTEMVSSRAEANSDSKAVLENFFRAVDKANLHLNRMEEKLQAGLLVPDFDKQLGDVSQRLDHVELRMRKRAGTPSHPHEEETPQRKPLTALQNYERNGIFKAEFDIDELHDNLDYIKTKVTRGTGSGRRTTGGGRLGHCHTVAFPSGDY